MLLFNAAFVMFLLALSFRRVPQREQLSSATVCFALVLMAVAAQPGTEALLRDQQVGIVEKGAIAWFGALCAFCMHRAWEDLKKAVAARRARRGG